MRSCHFWHACVILMMSMYHYAWHGQIIPDRKMWLGAKCGVITKVREAQGGFFFEFIVIATTNHKNHKIIKPVRQIKVKHILMIGFVNRVTIGPTFNKRLEI